MRTPCQNSEKLRSLFLWREGMTARVQDSAAELMRVGMHLPSPHLRLHQDHFHLGGPQLPSTCSTTHIFLKVHTTGYKSHCQLHQFGLNLQSFYKDRWLERTSWDPPGLLWKLPFLLPHVFNHKIGKLSISKEWMK